jgi:hypothetical protein
LALASLSPHSQNWELLVPSQTLRLCPLLVWKHLVLSELSQAIVAMYPSPPRNTSSTMKLESLRSGNLATCSRKARAKAKMSTKMGWKPTRKKKALRSTRCSWYLMASRNTIAGPDVDRAKCTCRNVVYSLEAVLGLDRKCVIRHASDTGKVRYM